ncbi:MAG: cation:proton antiporter [Planctomycetota bacterium]
MPLHLIQELLIVLSAGLAAAVVCRRWNVSILIGYLVVGVIIGKGVLGWVEDRDHEIAHFAEVGVFLLLFSIGLEFSLDDLKSLGSKFLIGGSAQMLLVAGPVMAVLLVFGSEWESALLIGSAIAFSSTVLVFKTLSECGHSQRPHGRRAIGILLFQDAALVPLLLMIPLLTGSETTGEAGGGIGGEVLRLVGVSFAFLIAIVCLRYLLSQYVVPSFASYRRSELVVLFTIVSIGTVTLAAYSVGLPPAVGAFAAGLIFNGNRWTHQIDALVLPFRETFAAVFFVALGLILDPTLFLREPLLLVVCLPLVIVLKALAAAVALILTKLPLKNAVGMAIGLGHVGEFAFVLVLIGQESGVISSQEYQRVIAIAVGSLVLTPALIRFGTSMITSDAEEQEPRGRRRHHEDPQAVVVGAGPIGKSVASQLETLGKDVCLIDLSPINLHSFAQEGFRTIAGDATRPEILEESGIQASRLNVVCVPDDGTAVRVVRAIRELDPSGETIVRCRFQANVVKLLRVGANQVVAEENEAAAAIMNRISEGDFL